MPVFEFLKAFSRSGRPGGRARGRAPASRELARERLRRVLVQDRTSVSPQMFERIKIDLVCAVSKYMDIDEAGMRVDLNSTDTCMALVASIPVRGIKRGI